MDLRKVRQLEWNPEGDHMDMLIEIRKKIVDGMYEFSKHAVDQTLVRDIDVNEVEEALLQKIDLIENYPDDKYGPSCLVLGFTRSGRALHVQCSYPQRPLLKTITLYEPGPGVWKNLRVRLAH